MSESHLGKSKPPVACGGCGAEVTFDKGEIVGDPEAIKAVRMLRANVEQFLEETATYEDMFVSELRDRVGDFREVMGARR